MALPRVAPTVDLDLLITLATACRRRQGLIFGYTSRGGAATERQVEPHRLVHTGYRWYLVARDVARDDWRTFRVDRISEPRLTGGRFVPRDPPDAASFVARAVTTAPYRYQAKVIHAQAAVVAERVTPTTGMLEAAGPEPLPADLGRGLPGGHRAAPGRPGARLRRPGAPRPADGRPGSGRPPQPSRRRLTSRASTRDGHRARS